MNSATLFDKLHITSTFTTVMDTWKRFYENSLAHCLRKIAFEVVQREDGILGEYFADLIVNGRLIELKAVRQILDEHVTQTLGYLKSAKIEHGRLINFGSYKFEIKKYVLTNGGFSHKLPNIINGLAFGISTALLFRG